MIKSVQDTFQFSALNCWWAEFGSKSL